ncbi:MAG: hypothetical protein PHT07_15305 [Paludibacter sp.]|nr:hypothetical protein [Paludibacter sp.]
MKTWQKRLIIVGFVILIILLIGGYLWHRHTVRNYEKLMTDTSAFYHTKLVKLNDSVTSVNQVVVDLKTAINLGLIDANKMKNENWKLITNNLKLEEEVSILRDSLKYKEPPETIIKIVNNIPSIYIKTPLSFSKTDQFYTIDGHVTHESVILDSLVMFSYPEITIGWRRKNIFSKSVPAVTYYNKNPHFVLKDMKAIQVESSVKWYDRKIFWYLFGAGSVFTLTSVVK